MKPDVIFQPKICCEICWLVEYNGEDFKGTDGQLVGCSTPIVQLLKCSLHDHFVPRVDSCTAELEEMCLLYSVKRRVSVPGVI